MITLKQEIKMENINKSKAENVVNDLNKEHNKNVNKKFSDKHKANKIANDAYEKYMKNKKK